MSRLEELIKKLCPNGVEFKTLGEVCRISRGVVMSKKFIEDNKGPYPVYSSQTENNGELGRISTYNIDGEYLTWTTDGANAGSVFYRTGKFSITNVCGLLKVKDKNVLSTRFLYYVLQITTKAYVNQGMGNPKLMSNVMATVKVPVPPLEVQKEIARILDKFATLEAELEAELEARRKQYIFYREKLLEGNENAELKTLGEMIIHGGKVQINKSIAQETGKYPVINSSREALGYCDTYNNDGNSIVLTSHGAYAGYTHWLKSPFLAGALCYPMRSRDENELLSKFIYYWLQNEEEIIRQKFVNRSGVPYVNARAFFDSQIPVPPLSEQKRIVEILDKFSTLIDDISSGLPAEIKMRHQQYEHYRDKLLTFTPAA